MGDERKSRGAPSFIVSPEPLLHRKIGWIALAGAAVPLSFVLAFASAETVFFGFGPADAAYVEGFRVGWARGTTARWSRARASVHLPIEVRGPAELVLLGGRPERTPAEIEVLQEDRLLGILPVGPKTAPFELPLGEGNALLHFRARDADPAYGMKLEGLRLVSERFGALIPGPGAICLSAAGAMLLAFAFLLAGFSARASALATLAVLGLPLAIFARLDAFASLHWLLTGSLVPPAASIVLALLNRAGSKWESVALASVLVAGSFALFHPSYYFKDVDIHRDVAQVARDDGAFELWSRMDFYQQKYGLGRASVSGQRRPMPYPPVLHTIAGVFPFGNTEQILKSAGILFHALIALVVLSIARDLSGSEAAGFAAFVLAAVFPESVLELLRASYAALLGQLVAVTVVFLLLRRWRHLQSASGVLLFGALFAVWALVYNAGPLTLAVFLPLLLAAASIPPPLPGFRGLMAAGGIGCLLALGYYGSFVLDLAARGSEVTNALGFAERVRAAMSGWDAFGPIYVGLAIAGLVSYLKGHGREPRGRVLLAWALYALAVSLPVFLAPEPLYYFRRLLFVYPLGPILAVVAASKRRAVLPVAVVVLLSWSLWRIADFVEPFYVTHTGSLADSSR